MKIVVPKWYSKVELGDYTYMNDEAEVHSFRTPQIVKIGKYSSIGKCKVMTDGDHNIKFASTFPFNEFGFSKDAPPNCAIKPAPIIGNDCWICDDCVVYAGVVIGNGAVVAGNSIVTRNVPPYAVVAGNPARVVKYRFELDIIRRMLAVEWWDLRHDFICKELAPVMHDVEEFLARAEIEKHNTYYKKD